MDWGNLGLIRSLERRDVEAHEKETDGLPCSGESGIGPYAVVILSQDE
jgi:hypothetical protein